MPFSMKLWQVQGKDLQEINQESLNDEQRLEDWVVKDPSIPGINVLLIGRQVTTASRERMDLLAIDDEASLERNSVLRLRTRCGNPSADGKSGWVRGSSHFL
jgi:hypothetical protein